MRPLRLQLKGFTSFRDEQDLDLREVGLFAISGPTGSGKSSILDAMTYALFGIVERVGKQVGQLVSQGQPSMAVTLEFVVDDQRWQVTRRTKAGGTSMILLERWGEDGWAQAGEGADKVRDVNARIRSLLGLDYEAFTRSVLLPQGRFAEFLVGDAKERRDILKELLGLELFDRLAKRAGEVKRLSRTEADAKSDLLASEYGGVTSEAIQRAEQEADSAAARERELAETEAQVREVRSRWSASERTLADLRSLASEATSLAGSAERAREDAERLGPAGAAAEQELARVTQAAQVAASALQEARQAREAAETASGGAAELARVAALARRMAEREAAIAASTKQIEQATSAIASVDASVAKREADFERAAAASEGAGAALEQSRAAVAEAMHLDVVATVRRGLKVGDPCPVCGEPIAKLPKGPAAGAAAKAEKAVAAAEKKAQAAAKTLAARERDLAGERTALERAGTDLSALRVALEKERSATEAERAQVVEVLGEEAAGGDPVAWVERALAEMQALQEAERIAAAASGDADASRTAAEREVERVAAEAVQIRTRLTAQPVAALAERLTSALGEESGLAALVEPIVSSEGAPVAPETLTSVAAALAGASENAAALVNDRADRLAAGEGELLQEARALAEPVLGPAAREAPDLAALEAVAQSSVRAAVAATADAATAVRSLTERLQRAEALAAEVAQVTARAARFDALTKELRADRIVAFLQHEALALLSVAASRHLSTLSSGRYRLMFQEEEFYVVDAWNGEEARRARTLSGGETFLASLALALALSEEVRALSVTERARMDSLFLDEGFGTLDADTLETVVEAIEQLGGDGRMVGVITHVSELAIRLPTRIEVERSPRGSQLVVRT